MIVSMRIVTSWFLSSAVLFELIEDSQDYRLLLASVTLLAHTHPVSLVVVLLSCDGVDSFSCISLRTMYFNASVLLFFRVLFLVIFSMPMRSGRVPSYFSLFWYTMGYTSVRVLKSEYFQINAV